jgi:SulP family sulfate permease
MRFRPVTPTPPAARGDEQGLTATGRPQAKTARPPFDDVVAGVTVALVLVPQALAYAALAGLPPSVGIMAAIFPPLASALLGSSPYLQTGPTALTSLMTLGVLAGTFAPGSPGYVQAAALLALMVGAIRVAIGLARFGSLAYFMSLPVLRGFTSGAAVIIIVSQVPALLGRGSAGLGVWEAAWRAVSDPSRYNVFAIALAVLTFALVRGLRRVSPLIPGVLIAVLLGLAATAAFGTVTPVVGPMPTALSAPSLALPWGQAGSLALGAAVIAVVGFAEPAAIARTFASRSHPWDSDRELIAQGAANLASGLMHGMPVGGSFARSALNRQAGARTRLSGAVAGLAVLAFLPFSAVLEGLPRAVLAAIVVVSAVSLLQLGALFKLWRYAKMQATTALVTFALTLVMTPRIDYAVVLGISLAVFTHLYREAQLGVTVEREAGTVTIRFDGVLWFGSLRALERALQRLEEDLTGVERVVLDTSRLGRVDFSALMLLYDAEQRLADQGLDVSITGLHGRGEMIMGRIRRG